MPADCHRQDCCGYSAAVKYREYSGQVHEGKTSVPPAVFNLLDVDASQVKGPDKHGHVSPVSMISNAVYSQRQLKSPHA